MKATTLYFVFTSIIIATGSTELSKTTQFCPAESVESSSGHGTFDFPETQASASGTPVIVPCPFGILITGFEPITMEMEPFRQETTTEKQTGAERICKLKRSVDDLGTVTMVPQWDTGPMTVKDCRLMATVNSQASLRKNVIDYPVLNENNYRQIKSLMETVQMLSKKDYTIAKDFIDYAGSLLATPGIFDDPYAAPHARHLLNLVETYAKDVHLQPGYRVKLTTPQIALQTAQFPYEGEAGISEAMGYLSEISSNLKFRLPAEAIRMSLEQSVDQPRLKVTAYNKDLSRNWKEQDELGVDPADTSTTTTTKATTTTPTTTTSISTSTTTGTPSFTTTTDMPEIIDETTLILGNFHVLNVEMVNADIANLTEKFEYTFHPENASIIKEHGWRCVFWDTEIDKWSTDGMSTETSGEAVICKSSHFTAFSLLIDPLPLPVPGSDYAPIQNSVHAHILSILSSIGSAISIVGLAGTILTYGLFRCLRKERSNRLLLNLSIALFFLHLISISSSKDFWHKKCFIPSALLHYFLHASLFWMLMEAHHMHQLLISVFVKPESKFIIKRSIIAWGIPLIVVGVCGAVKPEVYIEGRHDMCVIAAHLNLPLYYIAYLAPVVVILVINFGVFCRIFKVLYKQTSRQKKHTQTGVVTSTTNGKRNTAEGNWNNGNWNKTKIVKPKTKTKYTMLSPTQIKGAITVMVLVGVGWIVGLLAIGPFEVFFKYVFAICNAGQGAFIFIFRVVLHPQACREWKRALLGITFDSSGEVSTTSSTQLPATAKKTKMSFSGSPAFISASNSVENSLTPSNPDAKHLANTLAIMLRTGDHSQLPDSHFRSPL